MSWRLRKRWEVVLAYDEFGQRDADEPALSCYWTHRAAVREAVRCMKASKNLGLTEDLYALRRVAHVRKSPS